MLTISYPHLTSSLPHPASEDTNSHPTQPDTDTMAKNTGASKFPNTHPVKKVNIVKGVPSQVKRVLMDIKKLQ